MRAVKEMDGGLRGDNHQAGGGQAFTIGSCCALDGLVGLLLCNLGFGLPSWWSSSFLVLSPLDPFLPLPGPRVQQTPWHHEGFC